MKNRLNPAALVLALISITALTTRAHNLDTRATSIFFDKDFVSLMASRATTPVPLIQQNDEFWVVIKTTPGPGTLTGVGGYQTFYVPAGAEVTGAEIVEPDPANPGGFRPISARGQSIIAVGDGSMGAKASVKLLSTGVAGGSGFSLGPNINGVTTQSVANSSGLARGTIAGVYADTGIFYSTSASTAFNSYGAAASGGTPSMINNSGDTVGEWDAVNIVGTDILGVMTKWDSYQLRAFGRKDVTAIIDAVDQRGNAPWGMASAVAGPESGYKWGFDYPTYAGAGIGPLGGANVGFPALPAARTAIQEAAAVQAAIQTGPWNRIRYPGSQISKDSPGLISTTLGYAGIDGSGSGYALNGGSALPYSASGTTTTAVRFAIGELQLGVSQYSRVKIKIKDSPAFPTCPVMYADAFGGDAGGEQGGKDHIWRYFDPTVVSLSPCVLLQKVASTPIVAPNGTMYFDITFANSGTVALPNVVLTDTLPSGMTFVSSTPAQSSGPNPLVYNLGSVPAGAIRSVRLYVKCTITGTLVNPVTATSNGSLVASAYDSVQVGLQSALTEVKTVTPSTTTAGSSVVYTLTVSNAGTAANGAPLVINDFLPANFNYTSLVSATLNGGTPGPGVVSVNAANTNQPVFTISQGINVGSTLVLKFNVTVGSSVTAGTYTNLVNLNYESKTVSGIPEAPVTIGGGQIGDTVFRDWNGDGAQSAVEEGLPGVTVTLKLDSDSNGSFETTIGTKVTDANGNYLFTGLAAGNYQVSVPAPGSGGVPSAYVLTADPDGAPYALTYNKTLAAGETFLGADWGYLPGGTGSIGDKVFEDKNNNGIFDGSDVGIPNTFVRLRNANGNNILSTTTDASGNYSFGNLPLGLNYAVVCGLQGPTTYFGADPFVITTSNPISVPSLAGSVLTADFGFYRNLPATVGDQVYYDVDGSGTFNAGDSVLPNVTVRLYASDGTTLLTSTSTGALGTYSFGGLVPGTYVVKVDTTDTDLPANLSASISQHTGVVLISGQTDNTRDFPFVAVPAPLTKAVDLASATAGSNLTYTLAPTYTGTNLLTNVQVIDATPVGTTYVNPSASPTPASQPANGATGSVTWNLGSTTAASDGTGSKSGSTPATIALRGAASAVGASQTATLTINKPGSVGDPLQVGDLMIANISQRGTDTTDATRTGWTLIRGAAFETSGKLARATLLYRVADAADVAASSFAFALTGGGGNLGGCGAIAAFSGVGTTTGVKPDGSAGGPFDVTPNTISVDTTGSTGNAPAISASAVTTASANAAVIMFAMTMNNPTFSGWTSTSPGTLTELYDGGETTGNKSQVGAAWALKPSAGSTGAGQVTMSADMRWGAILLALKPGTTNAYNYTTTAALSANRSMVKTGDPVTVTMTVTATGTGLPVTVTPGVLTAVGTNGASAVFGAASPTSQTLTTSGTGLTFTYTSSAVTAGATPGILTFTAAPSDNKGGTWASGTANTTIATPVFTYQAKVNTSPAPTLVNNTAQITSSSGITSGNSNQVTTLIDASIGDFVWADVNGDGLQGGSEPGISGVTVQLYSDANNDGSINGADAIVATAVTDSTGHYRIYNVTAGSNYTVMYDFASVPAGYLPTSASNTPNTDKRVHDVGTLVVGQQYSAADFGLRPPASSSGSIGSIGDFVWRDANNDGVQDPGESGIGSVTLRLYRDVNGDGLYDAADLLLGTTTTNASGIYGFTGLPIGSDAGSAVKYLVQVDTSTLPAGMAATSGTGNPKSVSLYTGVETVNTADFGYNYNGSIGDTVFYDNGTGGGTPSDGIQNGSEAGVNGVVVTLYNDLGVIGTFEPGTDTAISSTVTATNVAAGKYLFGSLAAGNYLVVVEEGTVPAPPASANAGLLGYMVASAGTGKAITLPASDSNLTADFGFVEAGLLEGTAFWDVNHNGVLEVSDVRRAGITVWLDTNNDTIKDAGEPSTVTDASGDYQFLVSPGTYVVRYDSTDSDWTPVAIQGPLGVQTTAGSYTVTVAAGQEVSNLIFGRDNSGSIGDKVFADLTNIGVQDLTDPGIQGVTVNLYSNPNGSAGIDGDEVFVDSQVTNATGDYLFAGLPDGNYQVRVDTSVTSLPAAYNTTSSYEPDGTHNSVNAALVSGANSVLTVDFGYQLVAGTYYSVSGTIYDDKITTGNHLIDGGESGLSGVRVFVTVDPPGASPPVVYTVFSDGSGLYTLSGIPENSIVTVQVDTTTLPNSAYQISDDPNDDPLSSTYLLPNPVTANVNNQNFGYNQVLGSIAGTVASGNGNGLFEVGADTPLALATVTLRYAGADGILNTTDDDISFPPQVAGSGGTYNFSGLLPGLYSVTESNPAGYVSLADRDGGNPDNITATLTVGQNLAAQDFEDALPDPVVGDYIWLDEDGDGIQDAGEAGIPNVYVQLYRTGDDLVLGTGDDVLLEETVTDANGGYLFNNLYPNTSYRVVVNISTLPAALAANPTFDLDGIKDHQTDVTTPLSGEGVFTADFGYNWAPSTDVTGGTGTGAIGDRVWVDANGDGRQDPGEAGLGGVTVQLWYDSDGNGVVDALYASATSAADGSYIFDGLTKGIYDVRVTAGTTGYTQTGDPDAAKDEKTTTPIILAAGDVYVNVDFGYQPTPATTGTVSGTIWLDADADQVGPNGNGLAPGTDNTESTSAGVTVALIKDSNGNGAWDTGELIIATTQTDSNGYFAFPGLPLTDGAGTDDYLVWVNDSGNVLTDLKATYDANGVLLTPNLSAATDLTSAGDDLQDFGYTPLAHYSGAGLIGDTVYLDRNGNGIQGLDEPGLEGVTVQLWNSTETTLLGAVATDENGHYAFGGLAAGTYVVKVLTATLPGGAADPMVNTDDPGVAGAPDAGNSKSTVILASGDINLTQDFGYFDSTTPNTISGTIWNDHDPDGTLSFETGRYAGVTLVLRDSAGNVVGTSVTDGGGNYSFTGLPDGNYTVDVTDAANVLNGLWKSTGPNPGANDNSQIDAYGVTVTGGASNATADFGYYGTVASLGDWVWNDTNADGVQDVGAVGIDGVEVRLTITWPNGGGSTLLAMLTHDGGFYLFNNLLLDENHDGLGSGEPTYTISAVTPSGFSPSPTDQGGNDALDSDPAGVEAFVARDQAHLDYDFGFHGGSLYDITGTVLADSIGSGTINNPGDTPLAGVEVRLYSDENGDGIWDAGDIVIGSHATDTQGYYSFTGLTGLPGGKKYLVLEVNPVGVTSVTDHDGNGNGNDVIAVSLVSADSNGNDFLDTTGATLTSISGIVYDDAGFGVSGDSAFGGTPSDAPLPGVLIRLYRDLDNNGGASTNEYLGESATNASGYYSFGSLPNGNYLVLETDPAAVTSKLDTQGLATDNKVALSLTGIASTGNNFLDDGGASTYTYAVSGTVYNDANHDFAFGGDTFLPGVTVQLYADLNNNGFVDPGDVLIDSQVTDAGGFYVFSNLPDGDYLVVETDLTAPIRYSSVTDNHEPDAANDTNTIDVRVSGGNDTDNNFLDFLQHCPDTWAAWVLESALSDYAGNPDLDRYDNLDEYAFCMPPDSGAMKPFCLEPGIGGAIDGVFRRTAGGTTDVTYTLQRSAVLGASTNWSALSPITLTDLNTTVSVNNDGTETVRISNLEGFTGLTDPITGLTEGFVRIRVDLNDGVTPVGDNHTSYTEVLGWTETELGTSVPNVVCCRTYNNPYLRCSTFTGAVDAGGVSGQVLSFTTSAAGIADLATILPLAAVPGVFYPYYLEVTSGTYAGHRFDVASASGKTVTLVSDSDLCAAAPPFNTLLGAPSVDLAGASVIIRPHWTLGEMFPVTGFYADALSSPPIIPTNSPEQADQVQVYADGSWTSYYLFDVDGTGPLSPKWVELGGDESDRGSSVVIPPGQGVFVLKRGTLTSLFGYGEVRENNFIRPLCNGSNLVGGGYPIDQSANASGGRAMNKAAGFFGSRDFKTADSFFVWKGDASPGINTYDTYYLLDGAPSHPLVVNWAKVGDASLSSRDAEVLLLSDRSVFIRVKNVLGLPGYTVPSPWTP